MWKLGQADLVDLPYPDQTFDLAACLSVIEHMPDPDATLKEMARVLQPDGVLILGYPLENHFFTSLKTLASVRASPSAPHPTSAGDAARKALSPPCHGLPRLGEERRESFQDRVPPDD